MQALVDKLANLTPELRNGFIAHLDARDRRALGRFVESVTDSGHLYVPVGAAVDLMTYEGPEVLMSGPAGTGKSRACLERIHSLARTHPGAKMLILRKTAVSLASSALQTWENHVAVEAIARGDVSFFGGSAREPASYRYSNGSAVVVGGMDKATKIMSTEYDIIFVQEAIELTEDDWESASTRLRNGVLPFQQLMADTNPSSPTHWLKQRVDRGVTRMLHSRHEDNPVLFDADGNVTPDGALYIKRLDQLTGHRFHRLRHGRWVSAEGLVYEEWDAAANVIDPFPIPDDWPRYWSIDFGYTNPFVCQWWAVDPDGRLILYREWVRTHMLVEDHADRIKALSEGERPPSAIVADHDAEGRAQIRRRLGMGTTPAKKDVVDGIQAVQAMLRKAGDGLPRMAVFSDALVDRDPRMVEAKAPIGFAEEIDGYVWEKSKDGKPVKESPVKVDDHSMDAARYMAMHLAKGERATVGFFG